MAADLWQTKPISIKSLHLDHKNPRLGRERTSRAPREIVQYLFDHDKAMEVASSIAGRGYFANEPLLAVRENGQLVVVEGNRRLAALKALQEPGLLSGPAVRQIQRLAQKIADPQSIASVPVTIAPSRRATDRLLAGRHIGTPVLAWVAENRASFILDKLEEGYTNEGLRDQLGFTLADIQGARQTRAIADMARSLELPEEIKAKLDAPRASVFTTLERVFDSTVGRRYLFIEPDPEHGVRGLTTKKEFLRGFTKLVSDIALGKASSRSLNKNEDIEKYFKKLNSEFRPEKKQGSFLPKDVISGRSVASGPDTPASPTGPIKPKKITATVLPRTLKMRFGNDRLIDIRNELVKLKAKDNPNAGAVLLRVFLELSVLHFLQRIGEFDSIVERLGGKKNLPYGAPTMKQMVPALLAIVKKRLTDVEAKKVEKAIRYDAAAPFTVSDLHAFVHQQNDLPSDRDILQFWLRTEPLFRLMLEQDDGEGGKGE